MTSRMILATTVLAATASAQSEQTLVDQGSDWRYLDAGVDPGFLWSLSSFNDSSWPSGPAEFGFGDGDESTVVSFGPDPSQRHITTYFRHRFTVPHAAQYDAIELRLRSDDGAVVYLNGQELERRNLPAGPIAFETLALAPVEDYREEYGYPTFEHALGLRNGQNVIAVEVHLEAPDDLDMSFDLELIGHRGPSVTRGPYVQNMRASAATVCWRTIVPARGALWVGATPQTLVQVASDVQPRTEHELVVSGLDPASTYFYAVGVAGATTPTGSAPTPFRTPPVTGTREPFRAWILGDSGTLTYDQLRVRDAFRAHSAARPPDLALLLGDNAYREGLDAEYQSSFFEVYDQALSRIPFWSTRGNHELDLANYLATFAHPTAGEAGGVASGTESYYSFDWANVHFLCLDSFASDRSVGGAMWQWAELDLMSTTQDWIVAFWHHPPYSKGSHDSDLEYRQEEMRMNFLPLLEDYGVALVLGGHSHSYERSGQLYGHYGASTTFDPALHARDFGDGRPTGSGAYEHTTAGDAGAVYVVAGSSGSVSFGGSLDHPVMLHASRSLGSVILDVSGSRMDVTMLDDLGDVEDWFSIVDPAAGATICAGVADGEGCVPSMSLSGSTSLSSGQPLTITAEPVRANTFGLLVYSFGAGARSGPYRGQLCLSGELVRTSTIASGGSGPCTGRFDFAFDSLYNDPTHSMITPGATVYCQYWYRDVGVVPSTFSEAIWFTVDP